MFNPNKIETVHTYTHFTEQIHYGKFSSNYQKELKLTEDAVIKKYGVSVKWIASCNKGSYFWFTTKQNPNMIEPAVLFFESELAKNLKGIL